MKVFVCGSCYVKNDVGKWTLPDVVCTYLDELMAEETEILVKDRPGLPGLVQDYLKAAKYKRVTVCVAGNSKLRFYNAGGWPEKYYPVHGGSLESYFYSIEEDFGMAEEADSGLAIWDGEDFRTFLDMVCICALGKRCRLYLINKNEWVYINGYEDLKEYKGRVESIRKQDVRRILEKCEFSDEMTEFILSENAVTEYELVDIVCQAPVSMQDKKEMLDFLGSSKNLMHRVFSSVEAGLKEEKPFNAIKHEIRAIVDPNRTDLLDENSVLSYVRVRQKALKEALDQIFPVKPQMPFIVFGNKAISFEQAGSGIDGLAHCYKPLYLFSEWYDTRELQHKESPVGFVTDPGMAEHYIKNEETENDTGEGYYRLEAWNFNDPEWKQPRFDYYYDCKGRLCWFNKLSAVSSVPDDKWYCEENHIFTSGDTDLNIRTPYKTGDIVLIDCRPFAPPFHAMILEDQHQHDSCFPNIVFPVPGSDRWRLTPLKHRRFFKDFGFVYEPMLSPLYRLRKVRDEELSEDEIRLTELRSLIAGKEDKAGKIWEQWTSLSVIEEFSWRDAKDLFERTL